MAASSVFLFAVFNGVSRPLVGWLVDRHQPHNIAIASYVLILIACILMNNAQAGHVVTDLIALSLFWFCLGGWLAVAPTTNLSFFNLEHYAQDGGIVFTAYGASALIGTTLTGYLREGFGTYSSVLYLKALLTIVGNSAACLLLKKEYSWPHAA